MIARFAWTVALACTLAACSGGSPSSSPSEAGSATAGAGGTSVPASTLPGPGATGTQSGAGSTNGEPVPGEAGDDWVPPGDGWIYGVVRDVAREPIGGICLDVQDADSESHLREVDARTDENGRWAVRIDPHKVRIEAWDCGEGRYGTAWGGLTPPARERDFILPPAGVVEGRVVEPDGDPIAGICVAAHDGIAEGTLSWRTVRNATTGDDGSFRLPGLARARSRIHYLSAGHCDDERYLPEFGDVPTLERSNKRWVRHRLTGRETTVEVTYDQVVTGIEIELRPCDAPRGCVPRATRP